VDGTPQTTGTASKNTLNAPANLLNGQTNLYRVSANNPCGGSANSGSIAVFAALPSLSTLVNSDQFTLSWPGWANDWTLVSTTNSNPANWIPVATAPASNGGQFSVTIPLGSDSQYFRLASPTGTGN